MLHPESRHCCKYMSVLAVSGGLSGSAGTRGDAAMLHPESTLMHIHACPGSLRRLSGSAGTEGDAAMLHPESTLMHIHACPGSLRRSSGSAGMRGRCSNAHRRQTHLAGFLRVCIFIEASQHHLQHLLGSLGLLQQVQRRSTAVSTDDLVQDVAA